MWLVAGAGPCCQLGHGGELASPGCFPSLNLGDGAVDCMSCVYASWLPGKVEVAKHAFCELKVGPALWVNNCDVGWPGKPVADLLTCEVVGGRWRRRRGLLWLRWRCGLVGWVVDVDVEAKVPQDTSTQVVDSGGVEAGSQDDPCRTGAERHPDEAQ